MNDKYDYVLEDVIADSEKIHYHKMNDQMYLAATDLPDFLVTQMFTARLNGNLETRSADLELVSSSKTLWQSFLKNQLGYLFPHDTPRITQYSESRGIVRWDFDANDVAYMKFYNSGNGSVDVTFMGGPEQVESMTTFVLSYFSEVSCSVEWVYNSDGRSITVNLRGDRQPVSEMYPFLKGEGLTSYYDRFMRSNASILLLLGPPGTGKTSFIRGLLQHTKSNALVSYDEAVLGRDSIFATFIEGDYNVFVIEDADTLLRPRKDGNGMMHKFLNVGDGLVTTQGKKMIFSTNLPSVQDVDHALIRPGRCFDVLNFKELEYGDAEVLCEKLGMAVPTEVKKTYSLAELFHKQDNPAAKVERKMGFM